MADIVRMPEVLAGAAEAAIQTWLVSPGATVAVQQPLAEIETDKAIVELTADSAGTIGRLLIAEGDSVSVGEPILVMLAAGEGEEAIDAALAAAGVESPDAPQASGSVPEAQPRPTDDPVPTEGTPQVAAAAEPAASRTDQIPLGEHRLFASPLVRRLAISAGVELSDVRGTGPHGRIVRRDLERHLAELARGDAGADRSVPVVEVQAAPASPTPSEAPAYEDIPLARMRKAIARRLTESKSTVPHFYLVADCRVDALLELRREVNQRATRKISINDFVLKAVAGAHLEVPVVNAIWNGDSIRRFSSVDIAIAVAGEGGLTTPVIRGVERLSLSELSAAAAELALRAREGGLRQHELEGGSFAVSNLGMYGTGQFTAILNPPQSGILAVGAARALPVVDADGALTVGQVMTVTLSADHRVVDGADAAAWLAAFQRRIENPLAILI